jgi:hypothetical protein
VKVLSLVSFLGVTTVVASFDLGEYNPNARLVMIIIIFHRRAKAALDLHGAAKIRLKYSSLLTSSISNSDSSKRRRKEARRM